MVVHWRFAASDDPFDQHKPAHSSSCSMAHISVIQAPTTCVPTSTCSDHTCIVTQRGHPQTCLSLLHWLINMHQQAKLQHQHATSDDQHATLADQTH